MQLGERLPPAEGQGGFGGTRGAPREAGHEVIFGGGDFAQAQQGGVDIRVESRGKERKDFVANAVAQGEVVGVCGIFAPSLFLLA